MEIQQHDGVVVEVAGSRQGFAKRKRGGRGGNFVALGGGVQNQPLTLVFPHIRTLKTTYTQLFQNYMGLAQ